nr:discoidin domain-containing protein [Bacteroidaceae bacterium]
MKRKLFITLFAAISLAGQSQENVWQKCNESLPVDIRIKPKSCFANTEASGEFIQLTQDNNIKTLYHSKHGNEKFVVSPENPAELTFDFKKVKRIDYLEYVPRQIGENGIVEEAEIYVKTAKDKDFRLYQRCNWAANRNSKRVIFKGGLRKPVSIKFRILKGVGGYASCAEMKFMRKGKMIVVPSVFADDLLTTLKPKITKSDVKKIKQPLLRQLAQELLQGTYSTDYRVAAYECYNSTEWLSREWCTPNKNYDQLQGVTGIVIKPGRHMVVVSGIPDSLSANMRIVAWYTEKGECGMGADQCKISTYKLHNGNNVIDYDQKQEGLAYISYFSEGYADANPPIRVHFVGETVNGYLTQDMTNEKMHQMTATAPCRLIDVVSKKVHAVWPADGLHEHCKADDGVSPGYRQYMNILDTLM